VVAIEQNALALKFVNKQTNELCLLAVKKNGLALKLVTRQTSATCIAAIEQNGNVPFGRKEK